ncbi:MAG: Hsp70 family protein, partial [Proteobacteria bacterium]|nr:Hsp70 family protein [Pseudomonadota bacterium]
MSMGRKIGIDLGTTNTVVAIADGKQPRVLRNREGEEMTVSVVSVPRRGQAGELLVGTPAYVNWKSMPRDTVLSVKRLMGRGFEDEAVQKLRQRALFEIKSPDDGTPQSLRVVLAGREYSPVQISAEILKKVKADAEARLDGEAVTHAVITVPAYFSEVQRRATRDAANLAGLQVIQILDEPTAAAIAFGLERPSEEPRTLLVYDFGGGTFDISILTWAGNVFVPMNLEGDMWLGGDDLDDVIIDMVASAVKASDGYDIRGNARLLVEVKQEARRLKEMLSASDRGEILISTAEVDIDFQITRRDFELAILPLVATFRRCACGQSNDCDALTCHRCQVAIGNLPVEDGRAISLVRKALQNASLTLGDI